MPTAAPDAGAEARLLQELACCVQQVLGALRACPSIEPLDQLNDTDITKAERLTAMASHAVAEAIGLAEELEQLEDLSDAGRAVASVTRSAFEVVSDLISVLIAAIDCRAAAA